MTIVELKTGAPVSPSHEIQATVQRELVRLNPGLITPGLIRHDEKDSHWYTLNGVKIPSLTSYLSQLITFPYKDDYNAKMGTWLHAKCAKIDELCNTFLIGNFQECLLDMLIDDFMDKLKAMFHPNKEFLIDCLSSYVQFKKDYSLNNVQVHNEVPLASRNINVAATLDKVFETPDSKLIVLYLGKNYKAIEISPKDQRLHLNQFYAIKMFTQMTNWGKLPADAGKIVADRLEVIVEGKQVKKDLRKYIEELRRKA